MTPPGPRPPTRRPERPPPPEAAETPARTSGQPRTRLVGRARAAWLLLREFSGERAYEIYLEHRRCHHPGEPVMSEREFWRHRTDSRDRNPRATCC